MKSLDISKQRSTTFRRTGGTTRQITLHIICISFQVFFFENNSREFGTCNTVFEERVKLHIFTESRQEYSLKGAHL